MMSLTSILSKIENCADGASDPGNPNCLTGLPQVNADGSALQTVLTITFATVSAITAIIIMVLALRFILSGGDPEKAASARKGIIYAFVGLMISLSANLIVIFLLKDVLK